jgi:hypothetical protein
MWVTAAVLLFIAILFLFFQQLISVIIVLGLLITGSISKLYKRILPYSIGFELVTFASIIFFFAYGPLIGLILSILMLLASTLLSGKITQIFVAQAMIYASMAVVSLFLFQFDVKTSAKILLIQYNIMVHTAGLLLFNYPIHSALIILVVHLTTNLFFINIFAEWLVDHL